MNQLQGKILIQISKGVKKPMKKLIAALLAILTLLSVMVVPATAAEEVPAGQYGVNYVKYGDVNYDGSITATDALSILKNVVGKEVFDEHQTKVADVDAGQTITATDALQVLKMVVGKVTEFDAGVYYVISADDSGNTGDDLDPVKDYVALYDKNKSVNSAYVKDPTADTSFVLDVSSLKPNSIYQMRSIHTSATFHGERDIERLMYSLQGLVNRDFGMDKDHSVLMVFPSAASDPYWLNQMKADGSIMANLETIKVNSWAEYLEAFLPLIKQCGIVLWDGNVPATANVAATICGLDGYLPVLANSPLHTILVENGVEVKYSLANKFQNGKKGQSLTVDGTTFTSTGSAKNDAYLWALDKYFPRCTSKYLAYTLDGAICLNGYQEYGYENHVTSTLQEYAHCLENHDYLIARRCFFFDLAPYKGEAACDDPAQKNGQASTGVDNTTLLTILAARYARANGEFGFLMGFPPWWCKYTSHKSQGSKEATWIEWLYCEYITCYNLSKEADAAHPASMTNGSLFYKYVPMVEEYENNKTPENITYNKNVYYYTIYVGDYDSSAWLKQHIHEMWAKNGGDKKRGTLPLMWSINPNLADRVPVVFDYMYTNKTDKDYIVGCDGGAGYIIPSALFHDQTLSYTKQKRPAENAAAGDKFAAFSKTYYDRFDMDITGFLINGGNGNMTKKMAECVSKYSPVGSLYNSDKTGMYSYGNTQYVACLTGIPEAASDAATRMYNYAVGDNSYGYNFLAYRTICRTPREISSYVSSFEKYAANKGMTVKYCDPYTYFKLVKESGQATAY